MAPKRHSLDSPNPVKHQLLETAVDVEGIVNPDRDQTRPVACSNASPEPIEMLAPNGNVAPPPPSPASNRARYLAGRQPTRICCNLDLMKAVPGSKIAITAICVAVFPASSNPDRRYIQLVDPYGSTGLTIWNANVNRFSSKTVGQLVICQKLVVSTYSGKRCLTMARDSELLIDDTGHHAVMDWWKSLLSQPAMSALNAHNSDENSIISVAGVVGAVQEESKTVGGKSRLLITLTLVDATGSFDVRTWNHETQALAAYVDRPIAIHRVRVTAFAGGKLAELLDGDGSVISTEFPGSGSLLAWWIKDDASSL